MDYIISLPEYEAKLDSPLAVQSGPPLTPGPQRPASTAIDRRESTISAKSGRLPGRETPVSTDPQPQTDGAASAMADSRPASGQSWNLDYEATVNALTLQFLNEHEATRVAALKWLIMLQRKAPPGRKVQPAEAMERE